MIVAVLLVVAGCAEKKEEITKYRVPKMAPVPAGLAAAGKQVQEGQPDTPTPVPSRMLAAMIPKGESTWFFKVSGPVKEVSAVADTYRKFLASVKFEAGKPAWTLPEGWTTGEPGNAVRFATLLIPQAGGQPLELSVTRLPPNDPDLTKHLRANLDRWRGQLGLPPLGPNEDPAKVMAQIPVQGGTAYLADLEGISSGNDGMSRNAPFAKKRSGDSPKFKAPPVPPTLGKSNPGDVEPTAASPLTYSVPEGWKPGEVAGYRKAAFEVTDGDKKVEITVTNPNLSAAARTRLATVNLWRNDLELGPITAEELPKQMQKLAVGSLTGDYVELAGPKSNGKTILGVIVDHGDLVWFFKLKGDSELAAREKPKFESFVKSIRFTGAEGAGHGQ